MEKKKTSAGDIFKPIAKLFRRFHLTIFFVFIIACLAGAIMLINQALTEGVVDPGTASASNSSSIDRTTLERLHSLHTSAEGAQPSAPPTGRINPFGE